MALQIRRGTEAERLTITPAEGELIYTTDTKVLYVGDGATIGGTKADTGLLSLAEDTTPQLGGPLDLNSQNITGVGNINTSGNLTVSGVISAGSGNFTTASVGSLTGNFIGSVFSDDSTILVDGVEGKLNLAFNQINELSDVNASTPSFGDVLKWDGVAWVANSINIDVAGDFRGSFYGDDSTLIIDGINNTVSGTIITGDINVEGNIDATVTGETVFSRTGAVNVTKLKQSNSGTDLTIPGSAHGYLIFEVEDVNSTRNSALLGVSEAGLVLFPYTNAGLAPDENKLIITRTGNFGFGKLTPTEKFDFEGTVKASSFKGSVVADDSTTIIDGIDGSITASSYVQFGSLSTANRNALSAVNGMVIYNTDSNRFQGYQAGGWINLDDGTAA